MDITKQTKVIINIEEDEKYILKEAAKILGELSILGLNTEIFNKDNVKICDGKHVSNAEILLKCLCD